MSSAEYIKQAYDRYFERLEEIAEAIREMKEFSSKLDPQERPRMEARIRRVEEQLAEYAEELSQTGIKIIKKVA